MKENKKYKERGITLIALVITIIVLLILAGVSIAMLTGNNGILTQAQKAKNNTEFASAKEKVQIAVMGSYDNSKDLNFEKLKTEIRNQGGDVKDSGESSILEVSMNGYNYAIQSTGDILEVKKIGEITGQEKSNTLVKDSLGNNIVVPAEFRVVNPTDNVEDGIIIEDADTSRATVGSQFVWIPVISEDQYVRDVNYVNTSISSKAFTDKGYLPDGIQPEIDDSINNENAERKAVLNSGGFYISRYEAGKEGVDTLVSKEGSTVWNYISQDECKEKAKKFINNSYVKSALCSGIQWDVMMKVINGKLDGNNNPYNVTEYNESRHTNSPDVSGKNIADKVYNIFDLEGNYFEYVAEKSNDQYPFIGRGGLNVGIRPASYRYNNDGGESKDVSFRFVLYVL